MTGKALSQEELERAVPAEGRTGKTAAQVRSPLDAAVVACADGFTAEGGEDVPLVFQVVRTGTTVATYCTANLVNAKTPEIPAGISAAQAAKLRPGGAR
ncbi:hypothetical protein [Streptomyces sp. NPDC127033]|uniref:hypothetical protein n=1 Tax=Streptomyces sp. NPDC127033 TaxID=3347110 RepID=UPI003663EE33